MTPEELESALVALGWRTSKAIFTSSVDWYAWLPREKRPTSWPDCTSNEKPPSFCIEPHYYINGGVEHGSVEFRLCGEVPGGHWLDFRMYSVDMKDCIATIPAAREILGAAWIGAHKRAGDLIQGAADTLDPIFRGKP